MQKAYNRTFWENFPRDTTPVDQDNLNNMESGIDTLDNRVIILDTTKLDKADAQTMVKKIEFDRATGTFKITYFNGTFELIDTMLEKIAVNFDFDPVAQKLIIIHDDGTTVEVDMAALITQYEFMDSDTIAFYVNPDGKVSASVKEGSIEEKHLRPNYLADIKVETAKAEASARAAAEAAINSENSADLSRSWAVGDTGTREGEDTDNSKYYAEQSEASSKEAKGYVDEVERKGNEAVEKIENAYEVNAPRFHVDISTGHLLFEADNYRYIFIVNQENGHLEWGLSV